MTIRDGQKQWKFEPWPCFLHPQRSERYKLVSEKEAVKLAKVQQKGYVATGDVKSLTK